MDGIAVLHYLMYCACYSYAGWTLQKGCHVGNFAIKLWSWFGLHAKNCLCSGWSDIFTATDNDECNSCFSAGKDT